MKFPFHVYLDKLERVARAAAERAPGLWSSPRSPVGNLKQIVHQEPRADVNSTRAIAEYVPPEVMRHIVESQPRILLALIGVIRVLAERVAELEARLPEGEPRALPAEIEVPS